MTTLRVLLDAPPDRNHEADWALYGDDDRVLHGGRTAHAGWPSFDAIELVLTAELGRLVTVSLPPVPAARALSAARFALEDQLAGAPEESHIAVAAQADDGSIRVAVVDNALMRAFAEASTRLGLHWRRIILESDLAQPPADGWCWCGTNIDRPGFVRTSGGVSIATSAVRDAVLPRELVAALGQSGARRPRAVRADVGAFVSSMIVRAKEETGVTFVAGTPWQWSGANAKAFAAAIDLQSGAYGQTASEARIDLPRLLRPALWLVACAIVIHAVATVGQWGRLQWQLAATQRELAALAQTTVPGAASDTTPLVAIARRDAELRHASGLAARDDVVPLLARAAPALAALPPGAIKALRYGEGHVVFELQQQDSAQTSRVQREMQQAGLVAVIAPTASGARLRVGFD